MDTLDQNPQSTFSAHVQDILALSFQIFPILVTPSESRNIFNSATFSSASWLFATINKPYIAAGLSTML